MDEQLDDILKNRIKEVFENFDDSSADEGWLLLREKYPEKESKRRTPAWLWWGSAAAVLLLCLSIGFWLNYTPGKPNIVVKTKHSRPVRPTTPLHQQYKNEELAQAIQNDGSSSAEHGLSTTKRKNSARLAINPQPTSAKKALFNDTSVQNGLTQTKTIDRGNFALNTKPQRQLVITAKPDSSTVIAQVPSKQPAKSINTMFANDEVAKPKKEDKNQSVSKKIHFGVYAATYFNYAKGSDNQINAGAGFSSDIKLGKKLKLVTGIAIGQNTFNYSSNIPQPPALSASALKESFQLAATKVNSPALTGYNANLIGLDIPINIKYEFNPQKNDTYISAGLSSGTFVNELYTYHYGYASEPTLTQDATTHQAFNSFYFAKTLNLAFGIGYPLGKNNRLVVEPFFKYPLDGLGSQQIRFGAGGVNLKLNFKSSKK